MRPVSDFDGIASNIAIWHAYNPEVKAELYSICLATGAGTYLVDPIFLQREAFYRKLHKFVQPRSYRRMGRYQSS